MPFIVAAVKSSRRGRTRTRGQSSQLAATYELTQPALTAYTASVNACSEVVSEGSWIRRNLQTYYTDFEPAREKSLLRNNFQPFRRAHCMEEVVQSSPTKAMEEPRTSPQNTPVTVPNGVEKSFKSRRSFNSRQRDVEDIIRKHPHKIPIIVERAKNEKHLGILDKSKFLVPEELTMSQLCTIIRRRLQLSESHAFYLMVNRRSMASATTSLAEIYRTEKDSDGFLYITYASQEMFG